MRFAVELILPPRNVVVARQLDTDAWDPASAALLGEHMIRNVRQPRSLDEQGRQRADLWAFDLDLDPAYPAPKVGDELELELM